MPTVQLRPGTDLKTFLGTAEIIADPGPVKYPTFTDIAPCQKNMGVFLTKNARIIPTPPSTNNLFFNAGRRRVRTQKYNDWIDRAAPHVDGWKWAGSYPVAITITVLERARANRDIANYEKAVTDLLVSQGVIEGDSVKHVTTMRIEYRPGSVAGVRVWIEEDREP
jgi:Holliday junction resolvase RusA-like endonuclease